MNDDGSVTVEAEDDCTADEISAFLEMEYPRYAKQLRKAKEIVQQAGEPSISDEPFFRDT